MINVTHVYAVNLDRRQDRWENFASRIPFKNEVERIRAVDGKNLYDDPRYDEALFDESITPGQRGCASSHFVIYRDIKQKQYPLVAIYEDDTLFSPDHVAVFNQAISENNFDLLYLGWQEGIAIMESGSVQRQVWRTHAYALTLAGASKICHALDYYKQSGGKVPNIDNMLDQLATKKYLQRRFCPKIIAIQADDSADTERTPPPVICGNWIEKLNESSMVD